MARSPRCSLQTNMSKTPDSILNFPQDIIFNILSRLPAKSLLRFRCVCTSWSSLISHPSFTKLHLTSSAAADDRRILISYYSSDLYKNPFYYFHLSPLTLYKSPELPLPYEPIYRRYGQFVGSSKGLICFFYSNYQLCFGTLSFWNPSINKYKILDGPHNPSFSLGGLRVRRDMSSVIVFGFGFVSRTCEFKVVGIVYDYGAPSGTNTVLVYSLSTNSWEIKEGVSAPFNLDRGCSTATYVDGFVNWLAYKEDGLVIVAFDLDNERFQVYGLPKEIARYGCDSILNSFGEEDSLSLSLSLCACYPEVNVDKWDVWVMGEYGVVDSWKKIFVISHPTLLIRPLLIKNEREMVLIEKKHGSLRFFDAVKNVTRDFVTQGRYFSAISYTASLALLDE